MLYGTLNVSVVVIINIGLLDILSLLRDVKRYCEPNHNVVLLLLQAFSGFLVIVNKAGKLVYVSENVADYLGQSMVRRAC